MHVVRRDPKTPHGIEWLEIKQVIDMVGIFLAIFSKHFFAWQNRLGTDGQMRPLKMWVLTDPVVCVLADHSVISNTSSLISLLLPIDHLIIDHFRYFFPVIKVDLLIIFAKHSFFWRGRYSTEIKILACWQENWALCFENMAYDWEIHQDTISYRIIKNIMYGNLKISHTKGITNEWVIAETWFYLDRVGFTEF